MEGQAQKPDNRKEQESWPVTDAGQLHDYHNQNRGNKQPMPTQRFASLGHRSQHKAEEKGRKMNHYMPHIFHEIRQDNTLRFYVNAGQTDNNSHKDQVICHRLLDFTTHQVVQWGDGIQREQHGNIPRSLMIEPIIDGGEVQHCCEEGFISSRHRENAAETANQQIRHQYSFIPSFIPGNYPPPYGLFGHSSTSTTGQGH